MSRLYQVSGSTFSYCEIFIILALILVDFVGQQITDIIFFLRENPEFHAYNNK